MAEAIILSVAKSILCKIGSFTGDHACYSVIEEIKAAKLAKKDLKKIYDQMEAICAVLEDAEDRQYANKGIAIWLRDLKSVVYDIDDLLDVVAFETLQRSANEGHFRRQHRYFFSSSNPLIFPFCLSQKLRDLRTQLENVVAKKNDFGLTEHPVEYSAVDLRSTFDKCSYVHASDIVGRDKAKQDILDKLTAVSAASSQLSVLPIVGMGGVGKTAVAKLVYHDVHHFDLKLWVCVSDKFHIPKIAGDILKDGTGDKTPNQDMSSLVKKLHDLLSGKKYLLVLDDVWVEEFEMWNDLKNVLAVGEAGSVLMITTRNAEVASKTGTIESYNLDSLPDHVCWSIFKKLAFKEDEEGKYPKLHEIGWSIIRKSCGIPLFVKCLASLWRSVRDDHEWQRIDNMDSFIELNPHEKVLQILKLSYNKLPSYLKPCFAHMSLYVKGTDDIFTYTVPYIWSSLGLLPLSNRSKDIEGIGYSYFMELVSKSLLQEPSIHIDGLICRCKIHDFYHDLAVTIMGEELSIVNLDKLTISEFIRHIIWVYDKPDSLEDLKFPKDLLKAEKTRTFRFDHQMKQRISLSFLEGLISNFKWLRILDLRTGYFDELPRSIGKLKHLRYLDLSWNPIIKSLSDTICKLLNLETFSIYRCDQLEELPRDLYQLQSLKNLWVTTCQMSLISTKLNELSSLQLLNFESCKRVTSLWDNGNVGHFTSLRSLYIINCHKLKCLPDSMKFFSGLQILEIKYCEELDLEKGEGLNGLQSLRYLGIVNLKLANLPYKIQSTATSLQSLLIIQCESLVELPDWLHHFTSLRSIEIYNCPNLWCLPKSLCHLKSLQKFIIRGCPHLSKRCIVPTGEDYSFIQHVPKFILDGDCSTPNQYL